MFWLVTAPGGEDQVDLAFDGPYYKIVFPPHQREDIFNAWGVPLEFFWDIFLLELEHILAGGSLIFNDIHIDEEERSFHRNLQIVRDCLSVSVLSLPFWFPCFKHL